MASQANAICAFLLAVFVVDLAAAQRSLHAPEHGISSSESGPAVVPMRALKLRGLAQSDDEQKLEAIQNEVEGMVSRVRSLQEENVTATFDESLVGVEEALYAMAVRSKDRTLVREVSKVRADLCADRGFDRLDLDGCEQFMKSSCGASRAAGAPPVPAADCFAFFANEADSTRSASVSRVAQAPVAAPAAAPGPAPTPGPGLFGGKVGRPLQEQGFDGPLVEHKNFDTHTEDWQREFGPQAGHASFDEICAKHPNNQWCRIHGYGPHAYRSEELKSGAADTHGQSFAACSVALMLAAQIMPQIV